MIDVTVKTLDSQNHVFNVEEEILVKDFKAKISSTINIPADQQRLIFRGRVLQDEKKLSEYNVANNVIHVVQRPSNQNSTSNDRPRPNTPASNIFPDDGAGGGRNAIIMGTIGLPTIDVEGHAEDQRGPRRSGATIRLLVGNQLLNRASSMISQLEQSESVTTPPPVPNSVENESDESSPVEGAEMEVDLDVDIDGSDQATLDRVISQVVNVTSAAALVAAIRQVNPNDVNNPSLNNNNMSGVPQSTSSASQGNASGGAEASSARVNATNNSESSSSSTGSTPAHNARTPTANRPENPRLRDMASALRDLLALQERLNPFMRFLLNTLEENRLYSEPAELRSVQYLFDTVSSIMHLLSHAMHALSDISCDFSVHPDERRVSASSSILVEQSAVVRAAIPVSVPAMFAQAAAGGGGQGQGSIPAATIGTPIPIPIGVAPPSAQPWRNPNLNSGENAANQPQTGIPNVAQPQQQQQQQQQNSNNQQQGPIPVMGGVLTAQQLASILPPGLQNLGALIGLPTPNGVQIIGGINNPAATGNSQTQQNAFGFNLGSQLFAAGQSAAAPTQSQSTNQSSSNSNNNNAPSTSQAGGRSASGNTPGNAGGGNGMLQNIFRNELSRSQLDPLLPCHTHYHPNNNRSNRPNSRPAEFQQYVKVESPSIRQDGLSGGELVELLIDLWRNSRLVDLLQPVLKDVVLNYLLRGRDPKNEAHVKTCAKGLAKKVLPFFEAFSQKHAIENSRIDASATYLKILTDFFACLMQTLVGQNSESRDLKGEMLNAVVQLQQQLIQMLAACHPRSTNIGLLFINYSVEHCLRGMSIVFKDQVRHKLQEYLVQVERSLGPGASPNFIVFKESDTTNPVSESSLPSSSSTTSEVQAPPPKSSSSEGAAKPENVRSNVAIDDLDIDEVITQHRPAGPPRPAQGGNHSQTDSLATLLRSLPSEWVETVQRDIRRQVEMPSQPSFSPGYSTLFPRKH